MEFLNNHLFTYFWLCWVFVALHRLSLVLVSEGHPWLQCAGFSLLWLHLLWSTGSRISGFSSCSTRAQWLQLVASRAPAQYLWLTSLVQAVSPALTGRFLLTAPPEKSLEVEFLKISLFYCFLLVQRGQ